MEEKKTKVLILIGDVGGGHMAPAKAIAYTFEKKYPQYDIRIMDLFTVADVAPFNTSESSYTLFTHNYTLQRINDLVFHLFNTTIGYALFSRYAKLRLFNPTKAIINTIAPDIVITNHPIVTGVVSSIKSKIGGFYSVAQITDLGIFFRMAADKSADLVLSPSELTTSRLTGWGVSEENILKGVFSIRSQIKDLRPKVEIQKELGLRSDMKTVLVMGGGVGFNKYLRDAVEKLVSDGKYQIILMTGKLNKLADELTGQYKGNPKVVVQRFTDRIQDFYTIADVVVVKPGMSAMLESELFEKPTVITRKVAVQEEGNVEYMLENPKFRYLNNNWNKLGEYIEELLSIDFESPTSRRSFDETEVIVDGIVKGFKSKQV